MAQLQHLTRLLMFLSCTQVCMFYSFISLCAVTIVGMGWGGGGGGAQELDVISYLFVLVVLSVFGRIDNTHKQK